mmetsp:Transcript_5202/g.11487  ORF Transcript_5202/g.11487 Transcript_5202/m.11487 type:complete len:113 (-) Transcript_5202:1053-1391(-)
MNEIAHGSNKDTQNRRAVMMVLPRLDVNFRSSPGVFTMFKSTTDVFLHISITLCTSPKIEMKASVNTAQTGANTILQDSDMLSSTSTAFRKSSKSCQRIKANKVRMSRKLCT